MKGRNALVTGATRGIGRSIAARCVAAGANSVVLVGRDERALDEVRSELEAAPGTTVLARAMDVGDEEAVRSLAAEVRDRLGGLDLLVNNAAIMVSGRVDAYATSDFEALLRTNVLGPFLFMREFLPLLSGRERPTVVNIASLAPTVANPTLGAYAASKAALIALGDAFREEVREQGVRVAVVLPGSTKTAIHARSLDENDDWMLAPEDVANVVLDIYQAPAGALISRVEVRPVRRRARSHPPRR